MTARAVVGVLALAAVLIGNASAQQAPPAQAPSSAPPVAVGPDWRYEKRGADVHTFYCQQTRCMPPSAVKLSALRDRQHDDLGAVSARAGGDPKSP